MTAQSTLNCGGCTTSKIPYSSYIPNVLLKNKKLSMAGLVLALASTTYLKKKYNNVNNDTAAKEKLLPNGGIFIKTRIFIIIIIFIIEN